MPNSGIRTKVALIARLESRIENDTLITILQCSVEEYIYTFILSILKKARLYGRYKEETLAT